MPAPGQGSNAIGNAYIVPEYGQQYLQQLQNYSAANMQRKQEKEAKEAADKQRQDLLYKYVGTSFNDKDYATGTAYDPLINKKLLDAKTKYADIIRNNPDINATDLSIMIEKDMSDLNTYSGKVKLINKTNTELASKFKDFKALDAEKLRILALNKAIHKPGSTTELLDPDEVDASRNYIGEVMDENPELILADESLVRKGYFDKKQKATIGGTYKVSKNGFIDNKSYNYDLLPFQRIQRDAKGDVVLDNEGSPVIEVAGETSPLTGRKVVDDKTFADYVADPEQLVYLKAKIKQANQYAKSNGASEVDLSTPEGIDFAKDIVYQEYLKVPPPKNVVTSEESNKPYWDNMNRNAREANRIAREAANGDKDKENFVKAFAKVYNNDENYLQGQATRVKPEVEPWLKKFGVDPGNYVDVNHIVPGGIVYSHRVKKEKKVVMKADGTYDTKENQTATKEPYNAVWYDTKNKIIYTQDEAEDTPKAHKDVKKWVRDMATANGVTLKEANELIAKLYGGSESSKPKSGSDTPKGLPIIRKKK